MALLGVGIVIGLFLPPAVRLVVLLWDEHRGQRVDVLSPERLRMMISDDIRGRQ